MGLAIILPEHLNPVDDIRFEDGHFWLDDGPFMLAVRPLGAREPGGKSPAPPPAILRNGAYRLLFLPNYTGPERTFTREELQTTTNGFVAMAATRAGTTAAAFRADVLAARLRDIIWINQRTIHWTGFGHTLELACGLLSDGARFATIDGREPANPVWQAGGLPHEHLPLSRTAARSNPYSFPYAIDAGGWTNFPCAQLVRDDASLPGGDSNNDAPRIGVSDRVEGLKV